MEIRVIKARDGVYDMFMDGEWVMSTKSAERIFQKLHDFYDAFEFYYIDLYDKMNEIL